MSSELLCVSKMPVIGTGVSLSERFSTIPSHNPFRPNAGTSKPEAAWGRTVSFNEVRGNHGTQGKFNNNAGARSNNLFGGGLNKLSVLRASKDAEILRLRSQLRIARMQLNALMRQRGGNGFIPSIQNGPMKRKGVVLMKRKGGGVVFGGRGNKLNLRSENVLGLLGRNANGTSPVNRKGNNGKSGNFFGVPRTKEDLDSELDAYMSKTKSKARVDLDKEIDEYMSVARSQSFAGKLGLIPPVEPIPVEPSDVNMEIV